MMTIQCSLLPPGVHYGGRGHVSYGLLQGLEQSFVPKSDAKCLRNAIYQTFYVWLYWVKVPPERQFLSENSPVWGTMA